MFKVGDRVRVQDPAQTVYKDCFISSIGDTERPEYPYTVTVIATGEREWGGIWNSTCFTRLAPRTFDEAFEFIKGAVENA